MLQHSSLRKYSALFEASLLLEKEMFSLLVLVLTIMKRDVRRTIYKKMQGKDVQQKQMLLNDYFNKVENLKIMLILNEGYE